MLLFLLSCSYSYEKQADHSFTSPCAGLNLSQPIDLADEPGVRQIFTCLNRFGVLDPFAPLLDDGYVETETSTPFFFDIAAANSLIEADQPKALRKSSLHLLNTAVNSQAWLDDTLALSQELIFARVAPFPAPTQDNIQNGMLPKIIDIGSTYSAKILTDQDQFDWIYKQLNHNNTAFEPALCLFSTPQLSWAPLIPHFANYLGVTTSPEDDRQSHQHTNSLWGLVQAIGNQPASDGRTILSAINQDARTILEDQRVSPALSQLLSRFSNSNELSKLVDGIDFLASVNPSGQTRANNELSALQSIMRLIHAANAPLECDVSILGNSILSIEVENLAVRLLNRISTLDSNTVSNSLSLIDILEWNISESVLDTIIELELCPILNQQLLNDLNTLELLQEPVTSTIFEVSIGLIRSLHHSSGLANRNPQLVNILSTLYARNGIFAVEDLINDLQKSDWIDHIEPILSANEEDVECSIESSDLIELLNEVFVQLDAPGVDGLLEMTLNHPEIWSLLTSFAEIAAMDGSTLSQIDTWIEQTSELDLLESFDFEALLSDRDLLELVLKLMSNDYFLERLIEVSVLEDRALPLYLETIESGEFKRDLALLSQMLEQMGIKIGNDPQ